MNIFSFDNSINCIFYLFIISNPLSCRLFQVYYYTLWHCPCHEVFNNREDTTFIYPIPEDTQIMGIGHAVYDDVHVFGSLSCLRSQAHQTLVCFDLPPQIQKVIFLLFYLDSCACIIGQDRTGKRG